MESKTLNVSIPPAQLAWLKSRKETGGFASASDVIRDLIRREQQAEASALEEEFRRLDASGSNEREPESSILALVRHAKQERRETARRS